LFGSLCCNANGLKANNECSSLPNICFGITAQIDKHGAGCILASEGAKAISNMQKDLSEVQKIFIFFLGCLILFLAFFCAVQISIAQTPEEAPIIQRPISKPLPLTPQPDTSFVVITSFGNFFTSTYYQDPALQSCIDVDDGSIICGSFIISPYDQKN